MLGQGPDGEVPDDLYRELRKRGYLGLAAPVELGGRGIPFEKYLRLMEIFSRSHGSIRMLVHVANGIWRAVDQEWVELWLDLLGAYGEERTA